MFNSIRLRLQLWYAIVLVAVIGGLASVLYFQFFFNQMRSLDARLEAAANYLRAELRTLPPHEFAGGRPLRGPRDEMHRQRRGDGPGVDGRDGEGPDGEGSPEHRRPEHGPPDHEREEHGPPDHGPPFHGPPPGEPPLHGPFGPPGWQFQDGGPRFGDHASADRLRNAIALPGSLLDGNGPGRESPYFKIWRADGSLLAESAAPDPPPGHKPGDTPADAVDDRPAPAFLQDFPPGFRWQPGDRREMVMAGPHGMTILVGKPAGRELGELRWFAWRLVASGAIMLVVGLAGGWVISRSITRPIDAIAATANEISARNLARRIETSGLDQELIGLATILNEMFARLEAAFERQSRFTSDASHELRTPLAVIHAHAELALSKPRSGEEYRETLAACLKAAGRMGTLVDGLLTLARADAGRLDTQFRELDWRSVVEEVVDQYRPQADTAGITLSTNFGEPLPVRGDMALLARVSSNLISNALRYTPTGGRVHVALRAAGSDGAVLAVEDTGCGIPLEDQSKVFERFYRADRARSRAAGGNGLGLAICKSLVEAHHGRIAFSSVPERGSRFEVWLPQAGTNGTAERTLNMPVRHLGSDLPGGPDSAA
jgi:heavy metal sensor kinase